MTIKARPFTPEALLSAPRRSAGVPNDDASLILYKSTSYDFSTHETTTEISCLCPPLDETHLITKDEKVSNLVWLTQNDIAVLRRKDDGTTELYICHWKHFEKGYVAGVFPGPADNLKVTKLGDKYFGIAASAAANPDGTMHNPESSSKPHTTGRLYRSLFVRHWDHYVAPARQAIFIAALLPGADARDASLESPVYSMSNPINALKRTELESPVPPDGGGDHFDISKRGLAFVAKDPGLNPALHTKYNFYLVPLSNFLETTPDIFSVYMGDFKGAMTSPRFSRSGESVAFLAMREDGYESDKFQLFVMPDISRPAWLKHYMATPDGRGSWDRSPSSVEWGQIGPALYLAADDEGKRRLFQLWADPNKESHPVELPSDGSVTSYQPLGDASVFVSGSSFVDSSFYYRLGPESLRKIGELSSFSNHGKYFGLSESQVSQIWFTGAGKNASTSDKVQAWVVRPSSFDSSKTYPMAFLVHGGPQGAWGDTWSTRWNPAVFAEQGYIVVCPNPTGSTGFGQNFTDAIQLQWGGLPYEDLVRCFEHVEKNLDYVDISRSVMLGASYGGFMCNWIQGHPLGRRFKALVCHDGVFSTTYEIATEELYFPNREFGGPWEDPSAREHWRKWDPSMHTQHWATPQLVIHSEKDYRLTMADGLAAFNILQSKGVESEFLTFPDETHFVLNPENSLVWHSVVLNFINKHVGLPEYRPDVVDGVVMDP